MKDNARNTLKDLVKHKPSHYERQHIPVFIVVGRKGRYNSGGQEDEAEDERSAANNVS
jgi:hypothetical protein